MGVIRNYLRLKAKNIAIESRSLQKLQAMAISVSVL